MGLDLTLLPLTHDTADWGFSHTMLELARTGVAQAIVDAGLQMTAVPRKFNTYLSRDGDGEPHYGDTHETPYGDALECVTAGALIPFADMEEVSCSPDNRAAWSYLEALDPSTRVALYYH